MYELLLVCAYLLGSFSFAIALSRYYGNSDPRAQGSGNPGATNMLDPAWRSEQRFAVIGHLYPIYFNFRGGKGVATTAGMLLGLYPPAALLALAVWLLTFSLTRISSLAALSSVPLCLPLLAWQQPQALLPVSVLSVLLVWRHRNNLKNLLAGNEPNFRE